MTEFKQESTDVERKQKQTGLWAAEIFSAVSLACLGFLIYNVIAVLNGQFDVSTKILMPMTATMFIVSLAGFVLIRRDRGTLGTVTLFALILLTSIAATLLIGGGDSFGRLRYSACPDHDCLGASQAVDTQGHYLLGDSHCTPYCYRDLESRLPNGGHTCAGLYGRGRGIHRLDPVPVFRRPNVDQRAFAQSHHCADRLWC